MFRLTPQSKEKAQTKNECPDPNTLELWTTNLHPSVLLILSCVYILPTFIQEISPHTTIRDVTNEMHRRHLIPAESTRLECYATYWPYSAEALKPCQTAMEIGVEDGCTILVDIRLRGGSSTMPGFDAGERHSESGLPLFCLDSPNRHPRPS